MYPLRDVEHRDRASGMRLRASSDDERRDDEPHTFRVDEPFDGLDDDDEATTSERATLAPPPEGSTSDVPRKSDPTEAISEVLFRAACGDSNGALTAAEELMARVPVVLMSKDDLRAEPLGYWELHMLAQIDAMSSLAELIDDAKVPPTEVVRVVCELVERKIIALR